jgi:hypothetical protein
MAAVSAGRYGRRVADRHAKLLDHTGPGVQPAASGIDVHDKEAGRFGGNADVGAPLEPRADEILIHRGVLETPRRSWVLAAMLTTPATTATAAAVECTVDGEHVPAPPRIAQSGVQHRGRARRVTIELRAPSSEHRVSGRPTRRGPSPRGDLGLSVRDAAHLLHISHQRVHQIVGADPGGSRPASRASATASH